MYSIARSLSLGFPRIIHAWCVRVCTYYSTFIFWFWRLRCCVLLDVWCVLFCVLDADAVVLVRRCVRGRRVDRWRGRSPFFRECMHTLARHPYVRSVGIREEYRVRHARCPFAGCAAVALTDAPATDCRTRITSPDHDHRSRVLSSIHHTYAHDSLTGWHRILFHLIIQPEVLVFQL